MVIVELFMIESLAHNRLIMLSSLCDCVGIKFKVPPAKIN